MIGALGVGISRLYTVVFALGAIQSVQVGMGEPVLILAFVVIVIGGASVQSRELFVGAILVGITDTLGRFLLPLIFAQFLDPSSATAIGSALASMLIYILMAGVLLIRPTGLFRAA